MKNEVTLVLPSRKMTRMVTSPAASQENVIPVEYTIAMMRIAPMSSMTAKAKRKERSERVTDGPIIASNPTARAISVATGTAHPSGACPPAMSR